MVEICARNRTVKSKCILISALSLFLSHAEESFAQERLLASTSLEPASEMASVARADAIKKYDIDVRAKYYPVIIFVPGVLGSRLVKENNGHPEEIWGRVGARLSARNLLYEEDGPKATASILDKIDAGYFTQQIYGNTLTYIRDRQLSNVETLKVFAYDWRQDNTLSAAEFNSFICAPENKLAGRKIIILAHSMGGLIVKKWFLQYYSEHPCEDKSLDIKVKKVVFLGTPHLGAPKSISAIADGFKLLSSSRSVFGKVFGQIDENTVAESLNLYGASFPSTYQLLPIYKTSRCEASRRASSLPYPVTFLDETRQRISNYLMPQFGKGSVGQRPFRRDGIVTSSTLSGCRRYWKKAGHSCARSQAIISKMRIRRSP